MTIFFLHSSELFDSCRVRFSFFVSFFLRLSGGSPFKRQCVVFPLGRGCFYDDVIHNQTLFLLDEERPVLIYS